MYTMKQACEQVGMTYEGLKFYCNQGLVPRVKRNKNNHRVFDEHDIEWLKGLLCLKKCGMGLEEMKAYLALCLQGPSSIPQRKAILEGQRALLLRRMADLQKHVDYIDQKQKYYDGVLSGSIPYVSHVLRADDE